ncbi:MAG TPA: mitochondrial fission ELM1 family protein [Caulobacteraceae bacterium]|nr:mitochondrial fission ELM1 family protein [Caulobacteraceae bacterium]
MSSTASCWFMTTGEAGFRTQARSLAQALSAAPRELVVGLKAPWDRLPAALTPQPLALLDPARERPAPPWPELLIACGRRTAAISMAIRRASGGRTLTVQIQDPLAPADRFDLVVAMAHDAIVGANVIKVETALHDVTAERLAEAARAWTGRAPAGVGPLAGVILGDPTAGRPAAAATLLQSLRRLRASGARLVVVASRRTPEALIDALASAFAGDPGAFVWDRTGDNPYLATLALSDRIIVTSDSVSMISEALATPHPVEVFGAAHNARHRRFLSRLEADGQIGPFTGGPVRERRGEPLCGLAVAVQAVRERLAARTGRSA